jgi:hypothetical protein
MKRRMSRMTTIAPPTTPPAMAPFCDVVNSVDVDVEDVGAIVGVFIGLEEEVEAALMLLEVKFAVVDIIVTFVPLRGIGAAVANAPTPESKGTVAVTYKVNF